VSTRVPEVGDVYLDLDKRQNGRRLEVVMVDGTLRVARCRNLATGKESAMDVHRLTTPYRFTLEQRADRG